MRGFLKFDKMITPIFIKIGFWLGVIGSGLFGIGLIISGALASQFGGFQIMGGLLVFLIGPFIVRIYCELLIILFKMHESMQEIKISISNQSTASNHVTRDNTEAS